MPRPKKVEKQKKEEVVLDLRQDREEFLRAFEKPTQIYRFLRARHCISPLFLHRTLLYMLERCSRNNARRKIFHVDDMLQQCQRRHSNTISSSSPQYEQLKINVCGFYIDPGVNQEHSLEKKLRSIDAEVTVKKTYRSRRKDADSMQNEEQLGVVEVPVNPRNPEMYAEKPVILHTSTLFQPMEGLSIKNYSFVFRVYETSDDVTESSSDSSEEADSDNESGEGRKRKAKHDPAAISLKNLTSGSRPRRRRNTIEDDKSDDDNEKDVVVSEPPRKITKISSDRTRAAIYEAELDIYTSERQILLLDGDYELSLTRKSPRTSDGRKNATWEALDDGREIKVLSTMTNTPVLKFSLKWSELDKPGPLAEVAVENKTAGEEPEAKRVRRKASTKQEEETITENGSAQQQIPSKLPFEMVEYRKRKQKLLKEHKVNGDVNGVHEASQPFVCYQFIYNNESQQQTEARHDLHCPWCRLNCITLYGLIKHLKMTHPRFHFTYIPQTEGCCVEVAVNECYDGSYCGNPQFVFSQPGMAFCRRGPVRRIAVTDTLVFRSERDRKLPRVDPSELLEKEENEPPPAAHYAAGHHRLYFHSDTDMPIRPCEFDNDSEEEPDPDWLKVHIGKMIDEFTDVNDGEKPIMKLWNLFIMKSSCIADLQMADTCRDFINKYGKTIHNLNLRRNLLLHLVNMVDFGVLKTSMLLALMRHYDSMTIKETNLNEDSASKYLDKNCLNNSSCSTDKSDQLERLQKIVNAAQTDNSKNSVES